MNPAIILALLSGLIFSISNLIDKIIVSKHITKPLHMVIFGGLFIAIISLILLPFSEKISLLHLLLILLTTILTYWGAILYFTGMKHEEPSRIVPLFGFIVIFTVLLSAIFLNEVFSSQIYFGIAIMIIGSWVITAKKNIFSPFKNRFFGLIILASFLWSISIVMNKYLLNFYPVMTIICWRFVFYGLISIILAIKYRKELKEVWRKKRKYAFLQGFNEIIVFSGNVLYLTAASLWFVSLTSALSSVQYLFIFLFSLIIHKLKPELLGEIVNRRIIFQKLTAILLIIGGIFFITL